MGGRHRWRDFLYLLDHCIRDILEDCFQQRCACGTGRFYHRHPLGGGRVSAYRPLAREAQNLTSEPMTGHVAVWPAIRPVTPAPTSSSKMMRTWWSSRQTASRCGPRVPSTTNSSLASASTPAGRFPAQWPGRVPQAPPLAGEVRLREDDFLSVLGLDERSYRRLRAIAEAAQVVRETRGVPEPGR